MLEQKTEVDCCTCFSRTGLRTSANKFVSSAVAVCRRGWTSFIERLLVLHGIEKIRLVQTQTMKQTSIKALQNKVQKEEQEFVHKLTASELFMRRRRWQVSTNILHGEITEIRIWYNFCDKTFINKIIENKLCQNSRYTLKAEVSFS
jgi:hypothetical protein